LDFGKHAVGLKLTPALARLLYYVHREPGCRQADLAVFFDISPVTLGRMIQRLAASGYVERHPDPEDRRAVRVRVTPRGVPLVTRTMDIAKLSHDRALRGFSASEQRMLFALLGRLRANLDDK